MVRTKSHIPLPKAARRGGYAGCGFAARKRTPRRDASIEAARRICREGAVGVFRRNAKRRQKRRKRPDFDASPFCREARRHWQNVKDREIDVATGFFAGALPRIRGKASEPEAETSPPRTRDHDRSKRARTLKGNLIFYTNIR